MENLKLVEQVEAIQSAYSTILGQISFVKDEGVRKVLMKHAEDSYDYMLQSVICDQMHQEKVIAERMKLGQRLDE